MQLEFNLSPPSPPSPPQEEHEPWTEREIIALQEAVLIDALRTIAGAGGRRGETRKEAMEWLMREDEGPFGFRQCALAAGCDPDELRSAVVFSIRPKRI